MEEGRFKAEGLLSFVTNCHIVPRAGEEIPLFFETFRADGLPGVFARLDGYYIVPKEEFDIRKKEA